MATVSYKDRRREAHTHAEQKRRDAIKVCQLVVLFLSRCCSHIGHIWMLREDLGIEVRLQVTIVVMLGRVDFKHLEIGSLFYKNFKLIVLIFADVFSFLFS